MDLSRVEKIFHLCHSLPPSERDAILARECAGDPDLESKVRDVLQWHDSEDGKSFADTPLVRRLSRIDHRTAGAIDATAEPLLPAGTVLAERYRIDEFVAAGGMGRVYRALDLEFDERIALKTIRPSLTANPQTLRRFKQEVLLARSITHPNVCRIFDLGEDEATHSTFLTMDFIEGETLEARIGRKGALSADESLTLLRDIADAVDAAHRAGIVHRDLKSSNVMIATSGDERAVVTDFGLAKVAESMDDGESTATDAETSPSASAPSHVMGTPAYMAPEQVTGEPISAATDLYALGVVLFEMRTGQLPFHGDTPYETAQAHVATPPPLASTVTSIEDVWDRSIERLLAKSPADRFPSATSVVRAVEGKQDDANGARHAIPAERDIFVGRDQELHDIARTLEGSPSTPDQARLLTLVGIGGTGKSRLARKYGWDSALHWPGGIWFCDLTDARDIAGIVSAVADRFGVSLGRQNPIDQLCRVIQERGRALVILDNFEQIVEHAETVVGRWIAGTAEARFLVTSRERLGIADESVYEVRPLDPKTRGIELFEARAWGHRPGFAVDPSNRSTIAKIVETVDGLPLAIEMAASQLRTLHTQELEQGLQDRFRVLTGSQSGRHATMATALDWSWDLLSPAERSAVAQAAVFEGGFTLDAGAAVIDVTAHDDATSTLDLIHLIQSLVDKSWLRARVELGAPRFQMYVTVQEYAWLKLRGGTGNGIPKIRTVVSRHIDYFRNVAVEGKHFELLPQAQLSALVLEIQNMRAACDHAIDARNEAAVADTFSTVSSLYKLRGPLNAAFPLGRKALTSLRESGPRSTVLTMLASSEYSSGMRDEAEAHFLEALELDRERGDRGHQARVLNYLGTIEWSRGEMEKSRETRETALQLYRELGDKRGQGNEIANIGIVHHAQGRYGEARDHYEEALVLHREVGNRVSEAIVLGNLGSIYQSQDAKFDKARDAYEAAIAIHHEMGNRRGEGTVRSSLGTLLIQLGQHEDARGHIERSLGLHREAGDRDGEAIALGGLGTLEESMGRRDEAIAHYEAALALHHEMGNQRHEADILTTLGAIEQEHGHSERARDFLHRALVMHRDVGNTKYEGLTLARLGETYVATHEFDQAARYFDESLSVLRAAQDPSFVGTTLCLRARLELERGEPSKARASLEEAESIAEEFGASIESNLAGELEISRTLLGDT